MLNFVPTLRRTTKLRQIMSKYQTSSLNDLNQSYKYHIHDYLQKLPKEDFDYINAHLPNFLSISKRQWERYKNYTLNDTSEIAPSKLKKIADTLSHFLGYKIHLEDLMKCPKNEFLTK